MGDHMEKAYIKALFSGIVGLIVLCIFVYGSAYLFEYTQPRPTSVMPYEPHDVVDGWVAGLLLLAAIAYSFVVTGMFTAWWTRGDDLTIQKIGVIPILIGLSIFVILSVVVVAYSIYSGSLLSIATLLAIAALLPVMIIFTIPIYTGYFAYLVVERFIKNIPEYSRHDISLLAASGAVPGSLICIALALIRLYYPFYSMLELFVSFILLFVLTFVCGISTGFLFRRRSSSGDTVVQSMIPWFLLGIFILILPFIFDVLVSKNAFGNILSQVVLFIIPVYAVGLISSIMGNAIGHGLGSGS